MRKNIIAGNWKMNKTNKEAVEMLSALKDSVRDIDDVVIIIAPAFTALSDAINTVKGTNISISAQNVYPKDSGAYTGEVSPVMLSSMGVEYVIIGHSERREYFKESNAFINEKVFAILNNGMSPILCIGETLNEREDNVTNAVLEIQLREGLKNVTPEMASKIVVAYEPVWAIGTGKTATPEMAEHTHKAIREILTSMFGDVAQDMSILYGGSMKPNNAPELLSQPDIDGGLIGGASLQADTFTQIVLAAK